MRLSRALLAVGREWRRRYLGYIGIIKLVYWDYKVFISGLYWDCKVIILGLYWDYIIPLVALDTTM